MSQAFDSGPGNARQGLDKGAAVQGVAVSKFECAGIGLGALRQVDDDGVHGVVQIGDRTPGFIRSDRFCQLSAGEYQLLESQPKPLCAPVWRGAIIEKHGDIVGLPKMQQQLMMPFPEPVPWQNDGKTRSLVPS